jgi:hypothetical protein
MVALIGSLGALHVTQKGIHLGNGEPSIGPNRAMACHGGKQCIALFFHQA